MCDIDISSERPATDDNVLEITAVYGTQIATIKKETEMEIVIKKEVPAISAEYEDIDSDDEPLIKKHETMKKHEITDIPLVYTTKLDYMNTFNNIGRHTSQEVTEMIVEESKPHYEPLKNQPEISRDVCINSYIKLCSQIQQLNTKVKTETKFKNQLLLHKCKPLQIVLEDFKTSKRTSRSNTLLEYIYSSDDDIPRSPSSFSVNDDKPISNLVPKTSILAATLSTSSVSITVAVRDKRCQEADIYILDAKRGIKSYYRTNIKECNTLEREHNSKTTVLIEYCCWANREKRISRLIQLGLTRQIISYLRKPHNCLPRPCSCCCVFGNPILSKGKSKLIFKNTDVIDEKVVSAPYLNVNNIINKAKSYIPNGPNPTHNIMKNEFMDYLEWAVIIIKYHLIIFKQTKILGDNYEIGRNGALCNFSRPTVNRCIYEEKQLYEERDKWFPTSMKYFSFLVCCWHNREAIILRLAEVSKISPDVRKFMRTTHPCRGECVCCCKPHTCTNINLDEISTHKTCYKQKNPALKKVTEKRKTNTINKKSTRSKILIRSTLDTSVDIQRVNLKETNDFQNNLAYTTNKTKAPVGLVKPSGEQSNNNLSINSRSEHNAITTNPTNTNHKQNEFTSSATSLTKLIDSIFDKFMGSKLAVNENGKLTAVICAPPCSLPKEDTNVISDVLQLVSSQIEKLGIPLQEFCNRVNFSRNTVAIMPPTVPILPIITLNGAKTTLEDSTPNDPHCKVQPLSPNSSVPTTSNTSNVCSIYQVMSSLGGLKNFKLVEGYKSHFKDIQCRHNKRQINKQRSKGERGRKNGDDIQTMSTNEAKRKEMEDIDRSYKKLRVKLPVQFLTENPLQIKKLRIGNNNAETAQKTVNVQHIEITRNHPPPLVFSNSNFTQLHNEVGMIAKEGAQNQVPIVTNTNLTPLQNLRDKNVLQYKTKSINNKMPLLLTINGTDVSMGSLPGNVVSTFSLADAYNKIAQPPTIHKDKPPVDLSEVIEDISEDNCDFDNHVTRTETPLVSRSHSSNKTNSMQNIINAVVASETIKLKGPEPSVNPLLYKHLTQTHSSPTQSPDNTTPVYKTRQRLLRKKGPPIQENSRKELNKPTKQKCRNNKDKPEIDPQDDDMELDFESSIETTLVQNVKLTKEEILNTVNNKQLVA